MEKHPFAAHTIRCLAALPVLAVATVAHASQFAFTIKNTSAYAIEEGVAILGPLDAAVCAERGGSSALAAALNRTIGVDAAAVPALLPGETHRVVLQATASQTLAYIAPVAGGGADDVVVMNELGGNFDREIALYTSAAMPVDAVRFDLYRVGCAAGLSATLGDALPAQPDPMQLTLSWMRAETGYTPDGLSLGDVGASTGKELVYVMEGNYSNDFDGNLKAGRARVLSNLAGLAPEATGLVEHGNSDVEFMGLTVVEDLGDGAGMLFSDSRESGGGPFARTGQSANARWNKTGYQWAGLWNMGPSSGDVRTDEGNDGNEVVVPSWGGMMRVINRGTGEMLNEYDFFAVEGDNLYGHIAIADVHPAAGNELIAFGANTGKIYALSANTADSGMTVRWSSNGGTGAPRPWGSGPTIGDIDNDGSPEIVVADDLTGTVFAYNPAHGMDCKYSWTVPNADAYLWTVAAIGNVLGNGKKQVVVYSSNSQLSILSAPTAIPGNCVAGTVSWSYTVGEGGSSWFSPALADLTGDGTLDVVVANYHTVEVIDVHAREVSMRYSDPTARFFPSAVVQRLGELNGPAAAIYVSGWSNSKVYRLTTPTTAPVPAMDWATFAGDNSRTGSR